MKRSDKRGEKKAQFYLIAAIIISVIILGLVTMSNYARSRESINIQEVGEELKIESEKVLDYGTYNGLTEDEILNLMETFSKYYINSTGNNGNYYFLFGNSSKVKLVGYSESGTTISIDTGTGKIPIEIDSGEILSEEFISPSDNIIISIDGTDYNFELKKGKNFYFVVSQNIGDEKNVARN